MTATATHAATTKRKKGVDLKYINKKFNIEENKEV